ncbi:winged helix-turn-helix domain-containing protein [Streptomyces sp. NPDC058297]|uniref:winged helix-turn-helix domain-containing protein n=1 Tax=Streptomyces sp. NPDC058297 TaxID=3346433 RepID=UPI0036EB0BA3
MSIGFELLGDVVIRSGTSEIVPGSPRQRCVLALLLIDVNRPVAMDTLIERVWGATPPRQASATLYSYIARLRALRATPSEQEAWDIARTPAGYLLRTDETSVDLVLFRSEVDRARTMTPEEAKERYERALPLWRGRPFAGLKSNWLDGYRLTLDAEHLGVRLEYNELLLDEVHVRLNAYESALPHFAEALDGYRQLGDQVGDSNILNGTGWALARLGRYAEGADHCRQALPLLQHHGDGEDQAATWDTLGYIARHTGGTERALHAYGQALLHFRSIGNANREADTWSKLGDLHAERDEDARAREAWTTALTLYRRQGRSAAAHRMTAKLPPDHPG